jgi:hypothetical protein
VKYPKVLEGVPRAWNPSSGGAAPVRGDSVLLCLATALTEHRFPHHFPLWVAGHNPGRTRGAGPRVLSALQARDARNTLHSSDALLACVS